MGQWLNKHIAVRRFLAVLVVLLSLQLVWRGLSWMLFSTDAANGRHAVSGSITLDGKPLDNAMISFIPSNGEPFVAGANVLVGRFEVPLQRGLVPGKYAVRINASIHDPSLPAPPLGQRDTRPGVEALPKRYNSASQIMVEVRPAGDNHFTFDLESK